MVINNSNYFAEVWLCPKAYWVAKEYLPQKSDKISWLELMEAILLSKNLGLDKWKFLIWWVGLQGKKNQKDPNFMINVQKFPSWKI